jgi:glutamine cyclotransferase
MMRKPLLACVSTLFLALATAATPEYGYQVVHVYPHDRKAFTEGLEYRAGFLYESTGLEGRSTLSKIRLETGEVVQQIHLDSHLFGEGFTILNEKIVQLTYKTEIGFVYDQASLRRLRTFNYSGEGWSLTNDGSQIYMDDGSAQIRVWDPFTLQEKRRIKVHDGDRAIERVNELEWVGGEIYANVWQTDRIARISPADGHVTGWIDLSGILPAQDRAGIDVLNGIAYDSLGSRLFVTGKLWPKLFEIKLVPKAASKAPVKKAALRSNWGADAVRSLRGQGACAQPCAALSLK